MGYSRLPSTLSSKLPTVHFGVPAVLTRHDHDNPEFKYQFQFFHSEYEERQVAVLSPVMVTALTIEGDKEATWDEVEPLLILGCIVTLDVRLGPKDEIWNVFGLYFGLEKSQVISLHKKEECDGMSAFDGRRKLVEKERSVKSEVSKVRILGIVLVLVVLLGIYYFVLLLQV